tara:strand:+ start:598 stop:804 length:207 start_codon:yes stop_codon:yes gene_type:complete
VFTTILNAIAAIPALIASIQKLLAYFDKLDQAGFFEDVSKMQQNLQKATTEQDYKDASKEVNDVLKKL